MHHKLRADKLGVDNFTITKLYGISQDPETKNYIMVLDYAEHGSLRNYLDKEYDKLSWQTKFFYLYRTAYGLNEIHKKELIHRDLHIGNILSFSNMTCITDMGLCRPADYNELENTNNNKYFLDYILHTNP